MNPHTLKNLLAEGKTAKLISSLLAHTKSHDADLHNDVLQLSARFAEYQREKYANTEGFDPLSIERNKINAALLFVIDKLPDTLEEGKTTPSVKTEKTTIQNAEKIYNIQHIDNANFS